VEEEYLKHMKFHEKSKRNPNLQPYRSKIREISSNILLIILRKINGLERYCSLEATKSYNAEAVD